MAEIFIQSQAGEISVLPALPKAWPTGEVKGLRARGDVIVDVAWKDGKPTAIRLQSPIAQTIRLRRPGQAESQTYMLLPGKVHTVH